MPLAGINEQNLQPLIDALTAHAQNSQARTGAQVRADTAGLFAASSRDLNNSILPQLTAASENAGASGGALTALLAQNATEAQAAELTTTQNQALQANENARVQESGQQGQQLNSLLSTLQRANTAAGDRAANIQIANDRIANEFNIARGNQANQAAIAKGNQATQLSIAQSNQANQLLIDTNRLTATSEQNALDRAAAVTSQTSAQQAAAALQTERLAADSTNQQARIQASANELTQRLTSDATLQNLRIRANAVEGQQNRANRLQVSQQDNATRLQQSQLQIDAQVQQAAADRQLKKELQQMGMNADTVNNIMRLNAQANINQANNATSVANTRYAQNAQTNRANAANANALQIAREGNASRQSIAAADRQAQQDSSGYQSRVR